MIFDEGYVGGAAAEGFDANGAGASEDVEEAGAYDAWAEDIEKRFAEAVAGGTESEAFQAFEDAAAIFAGDDAHGEGKNKRWKNINTEDTESTEFTEKKTLAEGSYVLGGLGRLRSFEQAGA